MSQNNYYILLGIHKTANPNEIKAAYRRLAKKYHPDKTSGNKLAEDYFKEIQQAYSVLSNSAKRKNYDLSHSVGSAYYQPSPVATQQKHYTPYSGNAYQYAQQQADATHPRYQTTKTEEYKKDNTERNQLLMCVAIAVALLYFIVSYSVR